jgi:hypothetical protein
MSNFKLKPTHAPVKEYYDTLSKCAAANFSNEGNVRRAFESLLEKCARAFEWFVVAEYPIPPHWPQPPQSRRRPHRRLQPPARLLGG